MPGARLYSFCIRDVVVYQLVHSPCTRGKLPAATHDQPATCAAGVRATCASPFAGTRLENDVAKGTGHQSVDEGVQSRVDEGKKVTCDAYRVRQLRVGLEFEFDDDVEQESRSPAHEEECDHQQQHLDYLSSGREANTIKKSFPDAESRVCRLSIGRERKTCLLAGSRLLHRHSCWLPASRMKPVTHTCLQIDVRLLVVCLFLLFYS